MALLASEGSYVFVMEDYDHALSRGARFMVKFPVMGSIFAGNRSSDIGEKS